MTALLTMHDDTALDHVKLIASDMDLTLLADDGSMPPQMFERIKALDSVGVLFCAASGRPSYTLREMFAEVSEHMAMLSDNGARSTAKTSSCSRTSSTCPPTTILSTSRLPMGAVLPRCAASTRATCSSAMKIGTACCAPSTSASRTSTRLTALRRMSTSTRCSSQRRWRRDFCEHIPRGMERPLHRHQRRQAVD